MQYNNFNVDTYFSLVMVQALRQHFAPELSSSEPTPEKVSLVGKAYEMIARHFRGYASPARPLAHNNITSLSDAYCRVQGGEGSACACPDPIVESCALPAHKQAV